VAVACERNHVRGEERNLINSLLQRDQEGVICGAKYEIGIELIKTDLTFIIIIYLSKNPTNGPVN
jgi:hypothetical protein